MKGKWATMLSNMDIQHTFYDRLLAIIFSNWLIDNKYNFVHTYLYKDEYTFSIKCSSISITEIKEKINYLEEVEDRSS